MQSGRISHNDPAGGVGSIQPDAGGDALAFAHTDVTDPAGVSSPVNFELGTPVNFDTGKSVQGGLQAVNVRVVTKATE